MAVLCVAPSRQAAPDDRPAAVVLRTAARHGAVGRPAARSNEMELSMTPLETALHKLAEDYHRYISEEDWNIFDVGAALGNKRILHVIIFAAQDGERAHVAMRSDVTDESLIPLLENALLTLRKPGGRA